MADSSPVLTLTLGSRTWIIRPLTSEQIDALRPWLLPVPERSAVARGIAVVTAALRRDYPRDADNLQDFEAGILELAQATRAIFVFAGCTELPEAHRG